MKNTEIVFNEIVKLIIKTESNNIREFVSNIDGNIVDSDLPSHSRLYKDRIEIHTNPVSTYTTYISAEHQIAHELGHIFMHSWQYANRIKSKDDYFSTIYFDFGGGEENREAEEIGIMLLKYFNIYKYN
ncbi:MAG: ImmA/IrrE family metallo-endopeptidase [Paraclostridium sp.]